MDEVRDRGAGPAGAAEPPVSDTLIYASAERCWKCDFALVELRPPKGGWRYYCPFCEHLTLTAAEALDATRNIGPSAIGVTVAIGCKLTIEPVVR